MSEPKFPPVSLELVEHLERVFPDRAPELGTPEDRMWSDAGAARVVRLLREMHQRQEEAALAGKMTSSYVGDRWDRSSGSPAPRAMSFLP